MPLSNNELNASFSALVTGIASEAIVALGLTPREADDQPTTNLALAKFNIDLLMILQEKTENNLDSHEKDLILFLVQDLQSKYLLKKESI